MKDKYKIPVGFCPKCEARIAYSDDGTDKNHVRVECVDENYKGVTIMCHRCKSMLRVIEKPKVEQGYIAVPILGIVQC